MNSDPRYVSPPLGLRTPTQKTSVRRMAEGDSGEMSIFLNKHRAPGERGQTHRDANNIYLCLSGFPSTALSSPTKTWPEYLKKDEAGSGNQFEERSDFINGIETDSLRDVAVSPQSRYKIGQSDLQSARIQQLKNSASETRESFDRFVEKIFNGHNQQHSPTPRSFTEASPTFPQFSRPQDYRFSPSLSIPEPVASGSVRVTPHGEKATARSADSHWQFEDMEEVGRHFKRDAKYREYFEHKKQQFRDHDHRQPHLSPAVPVAPLTDHFHGFSDDPILSQVGRFNHGPRFTKSVSPDPGLSYPVDSQLHEFNEPLFYPAKQLSPASHSSLRTSYREKVAQVTPGPGLFSLTPAHTASPLPHPGSPLASPRPAAPGYSSQPLSYGPGPSVHSLPSLTTTASPWQFSPTPYTAYSHSSQERAFSASPTPSPYHSSVQHITENNLGECSLDFVCHKPEAKSQSKV